MFNCLAFFWLGVFIFILATMTPLLHILILLSAPVFVIWVLIKLIFLPFKDSASDTNTSKTYKDSASGTNASIRSYEVSNLMDDEDVNLVALTTDNQRRTIGLNKLKEHLARLSELERKVVELSYGLNGEYRLKTKMIALRLNISKKRVKKIRFIAVEKLKIMNNQNLES